MKTIKDRMHVMAICYGWYEVITKGLPLNVCKTVFGVYCFEGYYTPQSLPSIIEEAYQWGLNDNHEDESSLHATHRDLIMKEIEENL
jgi:hypothetical protein